MRPHRAAIVLIVIGLGHAAAGPIAFLAPEWFYRTVPGLEMMGPYNLHFVRDVGLAYLASGATMVWAARVGNREVALAGTVWPVLHALFHIQLWFGRGVPFDGIFAFDLAVVMVPAFVAAWAATRLSHSTSS